MCHTGHCEFEGVNGECILGDQTPDDCEAGGGNDHPEIYEDPDSFEPLDIETIKRFAGQGVTS